MYLGCCDRLEMKGLESLAFQGLCSVRTLPFTNKFWEPTVPEAVCGGSSCDYQHCDPAVLQRLLPVRPHPFHPARKFGDSLSSPVLYLSVH